MFAETSESMPKEESVKMASDEESKAWQELDIKIESESELIDVKELKDEVEPITKSEIEHQTALDVDKFELIESDEDDEMCDRLEIKTEIEDSQSNDRSSNADALKQEPTNEDSKSMDDGELLANVDEIKMADNEDFDLDDDVKSEGEKPSKTDDSLLPNVLPKYEIEDIQQKLHSFHSENLMILQTRNKKRASRATTPTSDEVSCSNVASKDSISSTSSSQISEVSSKGRKFSADDREYKQEPSSNVQTDDEPSYNQYQTISIPSQNPNIISQPITPTHSYPYVLNSAHRMEPNQPMPPAQMYQTTAPNFANSQLTANIASSNSLYQYLENPNRAPGYSTAYNTPPPMFTMNTSVPPPTLLNSSNYLTKNYSTLSEPSTPVTNVPPSPIGVTPSSNSSPINPKVLSRTQSADPRLNPQKDLPPVTPKRKLSINEYRKRKQLTTSIEKPKAEGTEKTESSIDLMKPTTIEEKPKNGMAVADASKETGKLTRFKMHSTGHLTGNEV